MALPKLFNKIIFHNNISPELNESNMNAISQGLSDVDDRVILLAGDVIEKAHDIEELSENPPYIGENGNWYTWNTSIGAYADSGIDASITVKIQDVTMLSYGATPYVTNTGTNTDPVFHLFIPRGQPGTTTYNDLSDKPSINSIALNGAKSGYAYGLVDASVEGLHVVTGSRATTDMKKGEFVYNLQAIIDPIFRLTADVSSGQSWTASAISVHSISDDTDTRIDAEIAARTAADSSLNDALTSEVTTIDEYIEEIITKGAENGAFYFNDVAVEVDETYTSKMIRGDGTDLESISNEHYITRRYEVEPYKIYRIKGCAWYLHSIYAIFNADDELIQHYQVPTSTTWTDYDEQVLMPYNASYIYVAYQDERMIGGAWIRELAGNKYNKRWIAVGDSLTAKDTLGASVDIYTDYVSDRLGITYYDEGVSGTGYANGISTNNAFYQRIATLTEDDPDLITIFGSFNDLGQGIPVGSKYDTTNETISGCINLAFDSVYTKYPHAILGVLLPTPWKTSYQQAGFTDYINAIKNICEMRNIPYLDLYHNSNLYPWDSSFRTSYYKTADDGAHPNTEGHKRIASQVIEFIKRILY